MILKIMIEPLDKIAKLISMFIKYSYRNVTRMELGKCHFIIKNGNDRVIWQGDFVSLEKFLKEHGAYFHEF